MDNWLTPLATLLAVVIGALIAHRATLARENTAERRTRRVEHLISAYRRLDTAANRPGGMSPEHETDLESAVADIMLLGQPAEIEATAQFIQEFAANGRAELDPVIRALRKSLRDELGLDDLPLPELYMLRMGRGRDERSSRSTQGRAHFGHTPPQNPVIPGHPMWPESACFRGSRTHAGIPGRVRAPRGPPV